MLTIKTLAVVWCYHFLKKMLQDLQNFAKNIGWIFIFKRPTKDDESMKSLKWRFFVVVALDVRSILSSAPTLSIWPTLKKSEMMKLLS